MKKTYSFNPFLELNLAILFMSTSGVLGRYINLPVPLTIFLRSFIAGILILIFIKYRNIATTIRKKDRISLLIGGILLGIHWVTYFFALQLSSVAIGMLTLFTFPVMTSLLEPFMLKQSFKKSSVMMGFLVLLGIYFIMPDTDFENSYFYGVLLGMFSALCYSVRNILLKKKVEIYNHSSLMLSQLIIVAILLLPAIFLLDGKNVILNLPWVLLLALITTAIGHTLFVSSLKKFSTTTASIISSLQPIYGIIMAIFFLNEYPDFYTVIGGIIILSTVLIESLNTSKGKEN